jgi:hypothetical protein
MPTNPVQKTARKKAKKSSADYGAALRLGSN